MKTNLLPGLWHRRLYAEARFLYLGKFPSLFSRRTLGLGLPGIPHLTLADGHLRVPYNFSERWFRALDRSLVDGALWSEGSGVAYVQQALGDEFRPKPGPRLCHLLSWQEKRCVFFAPWCFVLAQDVRTQASCCKEGPELLRWLSGLGVAPDTVAICKHQPPIDRTTVAKSRYTRAHLGIIVDRRLLLLRATRLFTG